MVICKSEYPHPLRVNRDRVEPTADPTMSAMPRKDRFCGGAKRRDVPTMRHQTTSRRLTYDDSLAHLPQAKWIAKAASGSVDDIYRLRVHDADTAMESVLAGLGKTLLPTVIADREPRLQRLETDARSPLPLREMWLLAHADQTDLGRIVAVASWLENVVMTAIKS
jgi:DNA-binding transcriptional LysR family regulator